MAHWTVSQVISALRKLDEVSRVQIVGSYATGRKRPKDIDLLLTLNIGGTQLESLKRKLKGRITGILRRASKPSLFDIFLITSDGSEWRLKLWEDTETGKITWDWE